MADSLSSLEEDLMCVICYNVFTDPVSLKCSHSLCEECLHRFWETQDQLQCPVCRKECSRDEPVKSLAFRALCESFRTRKQAVVSGDICPQHKEQLKLFCMQDERPICVICYTSKQHENHKCSPIEEAAGNLKEDLKTKMDRMEADFKKAHESCIKEAELNTESVTTAENQIKKNFEKFHQFLRDEEEKQIRALREEMKPQDVKIKARLEDLSKQISNLSERTAAIFQDMEAENLTFLQNYSNILQRLKLLSVPNTTSKGEKYEPRPMQTMMFTVWARMQSLVEQPPVTLDPDTASGKLQVSQDCTSVQYVLKNLHKPENPKRLFLGVLASLGFSSGLHCWDVQVRNNHQWVLGVVGETVNRKCLYKMEPKSRFWCFHYVDGEYKKGNKPGRDIKRDERPSVIRLQLDFVRGQLKFIDPFRNRCLCTFSGGFPEKVFPYFCTGDPGIPLSVFPAKR